MNENDQRLLRSLANLTGRQYIHNVLHLMENNEPLDVSGMMDTALKQVADDFDEWEAVPEAANHQAKEGEWTAEDEEEAAKIMKKAVDDFIERIAGEDTESVELRKEFYSLTQKRIRRSCITLKDRVWDG